MQHANDDRPHGWYVDDEATWFVVSTFPQCEKPAVRLLRKRGLTAYEPKVITRRATGHTEVVRGPDGSIVRNKSGNAVRKPLLRDTEAPMFPSYILMRFRSAFEAECQYRNVLAVPGVRDFLKVQGDPIGARPVPINLIRDILATEASERAAFIDRNTPRKRRAPFKVGQQVRASGTAFNGQMGQVTQLDAKGRVKVLLSLLGAERVVEFAGGDLVAVQASAA